MACPSGQTMFRTEGGISTSFVTWSVDLAGATARWPSGSAGSKEVRPVLWEPPTTHAIGAGCSCSFVSVTRLTGMQVHVTEKNTYDVNSLKINIYIYTVHVYALSQRHMSHAHIQIKRMVVPSPTEKSRWLRPRWATWSIVRCAAARGRTRPGVKADHLGHGAPVRIVYTSGSSGKIRSKCREVLS